MNTTLRIIGHEQDAACVHAVRLNVHDAASPQGAFIGRAAIVTLGCAKNQVDSEVMLGVLRNQGYEITDDVARADVVVVNTCSFLQASIKESIDCVLDLADLKRTGRLRHLVVVGCLVERFGAELKKTLPEVDSFISTDQILKIGQAIEGSFVEELKAKGRPYFLYDEQSPREISGAPHSAYVKIAEGCDRPCSFCIIPKIRGAMRSRSIRSIVSEAEALGRQGVREINLIAQDLTAFGKDQRPGAPQADLPALLEALDQSAAVPWVRLLYCYPIGTDVRLLKTMARLPSVCEYIDIPLQHSSERVLKAMQRPLGRYAPRPLVQLIRKEAPNLHIRSTFIVGFPGESEADIKDLEEFIKQGHFSHVGIFSYSKEDGTPAAELKGHLPQKEKDVRRDHLMRIQREVNAQRLKGFIGRTLPVLLEGRHADTDLLLCGRTRFQAPEVDGQVIINEIDAKISPQNLSNASIIDVEISDVSGYDLLGKVVQGDNKL